MGLIGPRADCNSPSVARAITVSPRDINPKLPDSEYRVFQTFAPPSRAKTGKASAKLTISPCNNLKEKPGQKIRTWNALHKVLEQIFYEYFYYRIYRHFEI